MRSIHSRHYIYTHWLRIDLNNDERKQWEQLKDYWNKYDCSMTVEFMRAFAFNAGITLHVKSEYGSNSHHITEALYKAVAHALRLAVKQNSSNKPLSTKGVL